MKTLIICQDCQNERLVETHGMLKNSYEKIHPRCHKCGADKAKDKIRKGWFIKGQSPWNKGLNGSYLPHWKGDNVGYDALHEWVERRLGKPHKCDFCGTIISSSFEWSNKSGQYKRDLSDWQRLCKKCHLKYDYENFGVRKEIFLC